MRHFLPTIVRALALAAILSACAGTGARGPSAEGERQMIQFAELLSTTPLPADLRDAYGPGPQQFGELRLAQGVAGRRPVVVLIHGGCWRAAYDLTHAAPAAAALARAGYVVWVPEYRRLGDPGGGWPGTFDDVARAVDHLRELGKRTPSIDTGRVVLMGHSAGGQLALWAASRREGSVPGSSLGAEPPLRVVGAVSLAGITDLATYGAGAGNCNAAVATLVGGTPAQVPERYRAVSPIERLPLGVPVRLVHGAADPIVPLAQSEGYAGRARGAGDRVVVSAVAGAGHFDVIAPQARAWTAVIEALRALASPTVAR